MYSISISMHNSWLGLCPPQLHLYHAIEISSSWSNCLKEKVTPKSIFFSSSAIKSLYWVKFQLLKYILSQEICLQSSLKFGISNRHFETNAQRPGRARPLSVTSSLPRDFVCLLEVMADLQPYRFEPERVPNPEDSEHQNAEEVNDRLEGTFWCSCERCQIITTQRECVCCREQPEEENKIKGRILSLYCISCSKWRNNFLCKLL